MFLLIKSEVSRVLLLLDFHTVLSVLTLER